VRSQNLPKAIGGFWAREIAVTPDGTVVSADDGRAPGRPRGVRPGFDLPPRRRGTAGNCCPQRQRRGVVVMSDTKAEELGHPARPDRVRQRHRPVPEIMASAGRGDAAHARAKMTIDDDRSRSTRFAAQVVPYQDLGIDIDKLNVNGGAIAVGHPFGMTGARLQNTMINSLQWHDKQTGLITMCVGGGQGMALILERLS
jgi:acetyl-CoA C-acetyltransferase